MAAITKQAMAEQINLLKALVRLMKRVTRANEVAQAETTYSDGTSADSYYLNGKAIGMTIVATALEQVALTEALTREQVHDRLQAERKAMHDVDAALAAQEEAPGFDGQYDTDYIPMLSHILYYKYAREFMRGRIQGFNAALESLYTDSNLQV